MKHGRFIGFHFVCGLLQQRMLLRIEFGRRWFGLLRECLFDCSQFSVESREFRVESRQLGVAGRLFFQRNLNMVSSSYQILKSRELRPSAEKRCA